MEKTENDIAMQKAIGDIGSVIGGIRASYDFGSRWREAQDTFDGLRRIFE